MKKCIRITFLLLAVAWLIGLAGCVSMSQGLNDEQRLYALQSEYNAVAEVAATYCESAYADPAIKARIKAIDQRVFDVLTEAKQDKDALPLAASLLRAARMEMERELSKAQKGATP